MEPTKTYSVYNKLGHANRIPKSVKGIYTGLVIISDNN